MEALALRGRLVSVDAGTVLAQGSPNDVLMNAEVRRVYLGSSFSL